MAAIEKEAKLLGSIHHPSIPVMHEIIKGEVGSSYPFSIISTPMTTNRTFLLFQVKSIAL